jgi:hypothetical protein
VNDLAYCVTVHCSVSAGQAFDFMADGAALGGWALGCFNTARIDDLDTVLGVDLATGAETFVRPVVHRDQRIIVYEVAYGEKVDLNDMTPWIWAIVHPGNRFGFAPDSCVISMIAWRLAGMSDNDWEGVCAYHDAEILLIKGQLERRTHDKGGACE